VRRFEDMERLAAERHVALSSLDATGLDALWNEVKGAE